MAFLSGALPKGVGGKWERPYQPRLWRGWMPSSAAERTDHPFSKGETAGVSFRSQLLPAVPTGTLGFSLTLRRIRNGYKLPSTSTRRVREKGTGGRCAARWSVSGTGCQRTGDGKTPTAGRGFPPLRLRFRGVVVFCENRRRWQFLETGKTLTR